MGMRLNELDRPTIASAIEDFYGTVSGFMDGLAHTVANRRYSLPRVGRRRGHAELPYFYAVDLAELFDFAVGRVRMQPSIVDSRCDTVMAVLFTSASGQRATPNWSEFADTPLGLCILACGARLSLHRGDVMTATQVMLLASWAPRHLARSGLIPIDADAEEPAFLAASVVEAFGRHGIAV